MIILSLTQVVSCQLIKADNSLAACASLMATLPCSLVWCIRQMAVLFIISLRTLLAQPLLWMRLKNIVNRERSRLGCV